MSVRVEVQHTHSIRFREAVTQRTRTIVNLDPKRMKRKRNITLFEDRALLHA